MDLESMLLVLGLSAEVNDPTLSLIQTRHWN